MGERKEDGDQPGRSGTSKRLRPDRLVEEGLYLGVPGGVGAVEVGLRLLKEAELKTFQFEKCQMPVAVRLWLLPSAGVALGKQTGDSRTRRWIEYVDRKLMICQI